MKKLIFLLFLSSPVLAIDVRVVNSTNNPVNVTGSITTNTSTHTFVDNFPSNQSVSVSNWVSSVSVVNVVTTTFNNSSQPVFLTNNISTFSLINTATITFNGVSQPVTVSNFPTTQSVSVSNWISSVNVVNVVTTTFNNISQPIFITNPISTYSIVNVTTITFNGVAQPVTCVSGCSSATSSTFSIVNVATVTFNNVSQPVFITNTISTFSIVNVATITFNGIGQPVTQSGSWTVFVNTVSIQNTPTVTFAATGVNASTSAAIPLRPSQGYGRTYISKFLDNLTANSTAYTVTSGKILYVTSIELSGFNSSTANAGRIRIQDGGNIVIPISIPQAGVGALTSQIPVSAQQFQFQEPKQFTTNVNINIVLGTITYSMDLTAYEE